ncbi:MAG: AI-2E family transporter [Methanosarcinales archaeon]|nr:AI-2E family transporter [ANME-2 cluster archaeon]MDF1531065.1 AI-2E family transporter [ANME-2 cluster archaeon]MDW7775520.1 AI-2E family transporter [Methanosarcinales archaeon]
MTGPLERKHFTIIAGIIVVSAALLVTYLSWVFVNVIILSMLGAYVLHPLDVKLRQVTKIKNRRITAILTIVLVVLVFSALFVNIIFILGSELAKLQPAVLETDVNSLIDYGIGLMGDYIPDTVQQNMKENFAGSASSAILSAISLLQRVVLGFISNIALFAMELAVVIFMVYYLLIDGDNIVQTLIDVLPSNRVEIVREFLYHLDSIYNSLFNVYLLVCVLTGIIGGIGLMLIGVPYPVMWGAIIAILALLPIVGPGAFYVPAAIYYVIVDEPVRAVILLLFGWLFLETIPGNVIRPRLMMKKGQIHPIITLLSFTAPLFVVGAMGIIVGPAAFGFMLALYRTYIGTQPGKPSDIGNHDREVSLVEQKELADVIGKEPVEEPID